MSHLLVSAHTYIIKPMSLTEDRLKELEVNLPDAPAPLGSYVPCIQSGNLLFLSGILPLRGGRLLKAGRVGESVSVEEAQEAARQAVINALSIMRAHLGSLDRVSGCLKVNGYVASAPDFTRQPEVLNAASDFLRDVFGENGRHARAAIGVLVLPLNSPVEVDFIFEIRG